MVSLKKIGSGTVVFLVVLYVYITQYVVLPRTALYVVTGVVLLLSIRYVLSINLNRKMLGYFLLLLGVSLLLTYAFESPHFMFSVLVAIVCLAEKKSTHSIIAMYFWSSVILFATTIILYALGVLPDNIVYRTIDDQVVTRSSLGFINPNSPMLYAFPILCAGYYLFRNRMSYYILAATSIVALYMATNSRTGLACMVLFLAATLPCGNRKKIKKFQRSLLSLLFPLLGLLSVIVAISAGSDQISYLNELLSNRVYYWYYYIENNMTFSYIGTSIIKDFPLDNMYIYIMVKSGILAFLTYTLIYYRGTKLIQNDTRFALVLVAFLIYALFETNIIMAGINFTLPILIMLIIENWTRISTNNRRVT